MSHLLLVLRMLTLTVLTNLPGPQEKKQKLSAEDQQDCPAKFFWTLDLWSRLRRRMASRLCSGDLPGWLREGRGQEKKTELGRSVNNNLNVDIYSIMMHCWS
jgi:hypothetical protein